MITITVICGTNTGQHMFVPASSLCNDININVDTGSTVTTRWLGLSFIIQVERKIAFAIWEQSTSEETKGFPQAVADQSDPIWVWKWGEDNSMDWNRPSFWRTKYQRSLSVVYKILIVNIYRMIWIDHRTKIKQCTIVWSQMAPEQECLQYHTASVS